MNQYIQQNKNKSTNITTTSLSRKIRTTFTYFSPTIRTVTNLFKHTNLQITYKTTNTIQQLVQYTPYKRKTEHERSGIYRLTCNACNLSYIGQTNRTLQQRYKEHTWYIKHNDPQSAYAVHILNNRHEYWPITDTMEVLQHISNPTMLLPSEQLFIVTTITNNLFPNSTYMTLTPYTKPSSTCTTRHSHTVTKINTTPRPVLPQTLHQRDVPDSAFLTYVF